MAQGKQSPRQKMINLMYLIFIAMMAMQVDRQVLRSFEDITVTLNESSRLTNDNNITFYDQIVSKAKDNPDYAAIQGKADQVKAEADKAFNAIEALKNKIMQTQQYQLPAVGVYEEETNYASLSNVDAVTNLMFVSDDKAKPEAEGLKTAIDNYKSFMATAYASSTNDKKRVEQIFSTADRGKKSWLNSLFYGQPLIAGLANLTKMQADIRTEEGNLVRTLLANKLQDEIELKEFQGIILAPGIVKVGQKVPVTIALGAYDNRIQGTATTTAGTFSLNGGKATFDLNTGSIGEKTISGNITYNSPTGPKTIPITPVTYTVVSETIAETPSGAVISADKMNVVYRNLDNPISATVNGADGAVTLTASVGGLSKSGSGWNFRPAAGSGTVTFTASAKLSSGKTVSGKKDFRIKPVPPARGHILNKTSITVPANGLASQTVRVDWPDFLFDLTANVNSFKVKVPGQPTASVTGNKMSAAAGVLSKARKGDAVFVFDIKYSSGSISGEASPVTIEVQ